MEIFPLLGRLQVQKPIGVKNLATNGRISFGLYDENVRKYLTVQVILKQKFIPELWYSDLRICWFNLNTFLISLRQIKIILL